MSKLWQVLLATVAVALITVYALKYFGILGGFVPKARLILAASIVSIWVKLMLQELVFSEISYYKQGYDFCIITLGTALTSAASEWYGSSTKDRVGFLAVVFVIALVATLSTAKIAKEIEQAHAVSVAAALPGPPPKLNEGIKSLIAYVVGSSIFILNVCILLTKP